MAYPHGGPPGSSRFSSLRPRTGLMAYYQVSNRRRSSSGSSGSGNQASNRRKRRRRLNHGPESPPAGCPTRIMASSFSPTSQTAQTASLMVCMSWWNLVYPVTSCCPYHAALAALDVARCRLLSRPCDPDWGAFIGCQRWQCRSCSCVYTSRSLRCALCFTARPSENATGTEGGANAPVSDGSDGAGPLSLKEQSSLVSV